MKNFNLPKDYKPYIDKYFLRSKEILIKDKLNPVTKYQLFIRQGNCKVFGINEAIAILTKYSDIEKTGHIHSLKEGDYFEDGECLMTIEAPIQNIIDLETMYLGVLSAETTLENDKRDIHLGEIGTRMEEITRLVSPRQVSYFGARHWRYDRDEEISIVCCGSNATNCSTDIGAKAWGENEEGVGTIPHALEAIYHWKYGIDNAVLCSTLAFYEHMDKKIPRIALVDYANREIMNSFDVMEIIDGIRVDTCGENYMQGVMPTEAWGCKGVSIPGTYILRKILPENIKIILSSGFGNPDKVKCFIEAEKILGIKLFDGLGVGGVYHSRMATADIIEVEGKEIHKAGRNPKDCSKLKKVF